CRSLPLDTARQKELVGYVPDQSVLDVATKIEPAVTIMRVVGNRIPTLAQTQREPVRQGHAQARCIELEVAGGQRGEGSRPDAAEYGPQLRQGARIDCQLRAAHKANKVRKTAIAGQEPCWCARFRVAA